MTDHTNTYPDLVNVEDWLNAKGYTGEAGACHQAMSLIRKQEKRIAELEAELRDSHSAHENRVLYLMKLINDISEQLSDYRKKLTNCKALLYSSDRAALGEKE
jgi:hypothetical protein